MSPIAALSCVGWSNSPRGCTRGESNSAPFVSTGATAGRDNTPPRRDAAAGRVLDEPFLLGVEEAERLVGLGMTRSAGAQYRPVRPSRPRAGRPGWRCGAAGSSRTLRESSATHDSAPSTSTSSAITCSSPSCLPVRTIGSKSGLRGLSVMRSWRQESPLAAFSLS